MCKLRLINENMNELSFCILSRAVRRFLTERRCILSEEEGYAIKVCVNADLKDDRYVINSYNTHAEIKAAKDCTVHAAVSRFFLESKFSGVGDFSPFVGQIDFTPRSSVRGMYFATHFENFYHKAPVEKIYDIIEDLAFKGCNTLLVWYDMHHYDSIDQPESVEMIKRLKEILHYAQRIGIKAAMLMIANEAFASSPEHLRANWHVQGRYKQELCGHYNVEICPSKKGGVDEILRSRRQVLEVFSDIQLSYIVYWPYDQGGCTCKDCEPWGVNGFLKIYPHFCSLVKEIMPQTEIILSTWLFDHFLDGEWEELCNLLARNELDSVSYIMSFFHYGDVPECVRNSGILEKVKFIDFPEISMHLCSPWGGFGANPLTRFLQQTYEGTKGMFHGGFPYSEGIFEDLNKWVILSLYSGLYDNAVDAVRGYVKHEFLCEDELLVDAIIRTEDFLYRQSYSDGKVMHYDIADTGSIEYVYEIITNWNELLTEEIGSSFKWRLIYLRAVIDHELLHNDFIPKKSQRIQEALKELSDMYYATENTNPWVKPPLNM